MPSKQSEQPRVNPWAVALMDAKSVELAKQGPLAEIADAFAAIEPSCDWLQNPNYSEASLGPGYADRYGYVELVGPGRPIESADLLVGLLMLWWSRRP